MPFGPVWMEAKLSYHSNDLPPVEVCEPVWFHDNYLTPAEACAQVLAMTRNIAATWDVVSVHLHLDEHDWMPVDVTDEVKIAYDKMYVSRRHEFV